VCELVAPAVFFQYMIHDTSSRPRRSSCMFVAASHGEPPAV
jgi:hypothetical protein